MNILITAGPTHEPIDPVRYIGNRSSGRMGAALAAAAIAAGHRVTLVLGPIAFAPQADVRIDVETAAQMQEAVLREFPAHDVLIMAAAVADFRPSRFSVEKLSRAGGFTIECEPTEDILAAASGIKRPDQRTVGFSLESTGGLTRAREKLVRKQLDLIVYNPAETMNSTDIEPTLLYPDGRVDSLPRDSKDVFARLLVARVMDLFK